MGIPVMESNSMVDISAESCGTLGKPAQASIFSRLVNRPVDRAFNAHARGVDGHGVLSRHSCQHEGPPSAGSKRVPRATARALSDLRATAAEQTKTMLLRAARPMGDELREIREEMGKLREQIPAWSAGSFRFHRDC